MIKTRRTKRIFSPELKLKAIRVGSLTTAACHGLKLPL